MTLVVIIGVLTGPTIVNCFNSADGMGVCLRGEMTNAGILPRSAATAVEATAPVPPEPTTNIQPDAVIAEPKPDATPPAAQTPDSLVAATFGLLRAEPDGSVVIAGSGTPGSKVEVYADDALIGTADVESSGDWVLVPEAPLSAGGLEITLGEAGKPGRANDSFVVAINEDKSSEPLVVASTPGAASDILQGVDTAEPAPQLAAADTGSTPSSSASAPAVAPTQTASVAPVQPTTGQPNTSDTVPVTDSAALAPAAATPSSTSAATINAEPSTPEATVDMSPSNPAPSVATSETFVATAEPVPDVVPPAAPAAAITPPTIDAIEIEGDSTFFAGAGPEGGSIRLYVDDAFVADSKVSDGRWLVEAGSVLKKPNQRVRIDLLQPGSAEVASRAEVNFAVELPAEIAVAAAPLPAASTPAPVAAAEPSPANTAVATGNPAPTNQAPSAPAASNANIEPAVPLADTPAEASVVEVPADLPPMPLASDPQPALTTTAPNESISTMVAVAVGGPDAERFASGKAIIRRGDNLWTIAKRVYGQGIKYTTIYEANTGQIRDPNRIYPGQVFGLPQGTAN